MITPEEYLKDEKIEDVLVGYNVPSKSCERLKKLQEALYQTRDESIRKKKGPILEGILLFGSFTRGKPEPGDIDIVPFLDFSQYEPEEDSFKNYIKKTKQAWEFIQLFEKYYLEFGMRLDKFGFNGDYYRQNYVECTTDDILYKDFSHLVRSLLALNLLGQRDIKTKFNPKIEHILGPKRLKEQIKRVTKSS